MATKSAINNPKAPDLSQVFNWGLKVEDFTQLFFITGHGALRSDLSVVHPDDPAAQARHILTEVKGYLEDNGYTMDDIVRVESTLAKEVTEEQFHAFVDVYAEFFADVAVKPSGGTLRYVDRLAFPGMLVEFEFLVAR